MTSKIRASQKSARHLNVDVTKGLLQKSYIQAIYLNY